MAETTMIVYCTPSTSAMKAVYDVRRLAQEDGFQVEFARLLGAEYLARGHLWWGGHDSCIFGSIDRTVWAKDSRIFFDPVNGPSAEIQGAGAWSKHTSPGDMLMERVKNKELSAAMVLSLLFQEVYLKAKATPWRGYDWEQSADVYLKHAILRSSSSWRCQNSLSANGQIEVMHTRGPSSSCGELRISSTAIRRQLQEQPFPNYGPRLDELTKTSIASKCGTALNPDMLVHIVEDKEWKAKSRRLGEALYSLDYRKFEARVRIAQEWKKAKKLLKAKGLMNPNGRLSTKLC
jgi:hypothetical protein